MIQRKKLLLILSSVVLLSSSSSFVVRPLIHHQRTLVATEASTSLEPSSGGGDTSPEKPNFLTKAANAVKSWFRPKHKVELIGEYNDDVDQSHDLTTKKVRDALLPLPWPVRTIAGNIALQVHGGLAKEERKAKTLLKDAHRLIKKDKELAAILGEPIHIGHIFSGLSSKSIVNRKERMSIIDSFEVIGSNKSGVAIMSADKYAKGHLKTLRVNVEGIHYDVDTL